ncbi:MAG TPA: DUF2085 domain-containing protein [Chloroflexota bacterium]|nr:DUF2085 domain-containing protein [Chloroflexota bacterium]
MICQAAGVGRLGRWLLRHWLLFVNLAVGLTLAGAVLAPGLDALGMEAAGDAIRTAYRLICPQRPSHSFSVFGHQLALEQRMTAMAAAQLIGGLSYGAWRARIAPLGVFPFILLSLPIAWDGFSQMVGLRDSDWFTRTWTGGLFSLAFVAFAYPRVDGLFQSAARKVSRPDAPRAELGRESGQRLSI